MLFRQHTAGLVGALALGHSAASATLGAPIKTLTSLDISNMKLNTRSILAVRQSNTTACADIASGYADAIGAGKETLWVKPSDALACLDSVPIDVDRDVALIDYLLPIFHFQSTLGYLKSPPKGYLLPGVDVIEGLVQMREKLRKGGYRTQYQFTTDLGALITASSDAHFSYVPALNFVFQFMRDFDVVSLSKDGVSLPKVYVKSDVLNGEEDMSEIETIDGVDIYDFLVEESTRTSSQDPDAKYNQLFPSLARLAGSGGLGNGGGIFFTNPTKTWRVPDSHTVKFANGTTREFENFAGVLKDIRTVDSPDALHELIEVPPANATEIFQQTFQGVAKRQADEEEAEAVIQHKGYPEPVVMHRDGYVSSYFLNDTKHDDVCVLAYNAFQDSRHQPQFAPAEDGRMSIWEMHESRRVIEETIKACKDQGKTKLIVDVTQNPGGQVAQGYELYRQLFPQAKTFSGSRLPATAQIDLWGRLTYNSLNKTIPEIAFTGPWFKNAVNGQRFPEWNDVFGPHQTGGGKQAETATLEYDFANSTFIRNDDPDNFDDFIVSGFEADAEPREQPFKNEDMVILTDGNCGSTCTIFVGLAEREQNIRTVAVGGRPLNAPMQAVGNVKGPQVQNAKDLIHAHAVLAEETGLEIKSDELKALVLSSEAPPLQPLDMSSTVVNFRNAYAADDLDGKKGPTHFRYQAASCRRFVKPEYLVSVEALWKDVAAVAWGGAKCVKGSTSNSDDTIGDEYPAFEEKKVISTQKPYEGPGSLTSNEWKAYGGAKANRTGTGEGYVLKDEDYEVKNPLPGTYAAKESGAVSGRGGVSVLIAGLASALVAGAVML